jgi:hypothetical protein
MGFLQKKKLGGSLLGIFKCLVLMNFVVLGNEVGAAGAGVYSQMFSGRPGTQSVEDFEDRLLAAYAKARSKDKKLAKAEFLLQLPRVLEHEALQLWRKKRDEILAEPEDGEERKAWDPIAAVIKLFKEHFGVPSVTRCVSCRC